MTAPRPTLVFDLDGTLADTAGDLIATLNVILGREGLPPVPMERARDMIGAGARALIRRGLAAEGRAVSEGRLEEMFESFLAYYADHLADSSRLFPGVEAALDRFAQAGFPLAVCTNKMQAHSVALLRLLGVADRFRAICGRDAFPVCKPDPRHLTLTVEQAGGDPSSAVMIGDSRTDIDTARAAGVPVVGVTFGYTDVPVADLSPDRVVDHFDAMWDAVAGLDRGSRRS